MPAKQRLKKYFERAGETVTLRQKGGTYNQATGIKTISDSDETFEGLFISDDETIQGVIPQGEQGMLLATQGSTNVPTVGDIIFVGDDQYVIESLHAVHIRASIVAYQLGLVGIVQ